ncbi:MAG: ABC transporter permease [Anaerolineae bacterium]|nr:ABC transporter permease [Anaerolineae bacterium]
MLRLVLQRLALMVPVALGIIFFCYLGLAMANNSQARRPSSDVPTLARRAWSWTVSYVSDVSQGRLGSSPQRRGVALVRVPIAEVLRQSYVNSVVLMGLALALATVGGVAVGLFSALHERSPLALVAVTSTLLGVSTPTFFAALLLQIGAITFYRNMGFRLVPVGGFGWDAHLVIPTLVLAARPLAHIARMTLVSVREVLDQEHVRTAVAKGVPPHLLWRRHVLRNAAVPALTGVAVSLRFSLSSLPVVETYFSWPGLGATLLQGIFQRQSDLVVTLALAMGLTFMIVNLALDVVYRLLDPRLGRAEMYR